MAIVVCNASPMVPPWQAREPRFGTNPICVSLPGPPDQTWLLDMATTTVAMGKIYKANFNNEPSIPPGWGLDKQGRPTTETGEVINGGMVAPLGGYKGYGLAMFVEILCAVLGGGAMSTEVGGIRIRGRPMSCSQAFIAIDIGLFLPPDQFAARMQWLVETVKQAAPAAGSGVRRPSFTQSIIFLASEWLIMPWPHMVLRVKTCVFGSFSVLPSNPRE